MVGTLQQEVVKKPEANMASEDINSSAAMEESVVGMATSEEPEVGLTTSEEGKGEPDTMLVDTEAAAASGDVTDGASGDDRDQAEPTESAPKEMVDFKVVYNKKKLDVTFLLDETVLELKKHLEKITGVPLAMQKVMFKGRMRDDATLRDHKITKGAKIMLVGSTVSAVMSVSAPDPKVLKAEMKAEEAAQKEPISKQKPHRTILEKHGKPDDILVGVKGLKEPLPPVPVSGMYNKSGGKVRLTFKMEQDQLWIGTKERTDKIPMGSIKEVVSEAIHDNEGYHLMGIQMGPTEASRYWVYWVPAQYVDAIKDAILGKFQYF